MMKLEGIVVAVSAFVLVATASRLESVRRDDRTSVRHESFDDWLVTVMNQGPASAVSPTGVSPTGDTPSTTPETATTQDILGYFRDVPREHWSCCMLGKLAGDKGFHCHAGFYAARLQTRNHNRAHNRRMPLMHGQSRVQNWGMDIMRTFQRCVQEHSAEFHKCCYAATVERREIRRWNHFREPAAA